MRRARVCLEVGCRGSIGHSIIAAVGVVGMSSRGENNASSTLNFRLLLAVLVLTMSTVAMSGEPAEPRDVRLVVTETGQYILSGEPVALGDLRSRLRELKAGGTPINLHVNCGPKVTYEQIMPAMRIVQEEGLGKVGYLTSASTPPDSSASASSQ